MSRLARQWRHDMASCLPCERASERTTFHIAMTAEHWPLGRSGGAPGPTWPPRPGRLSTDSGLLGLPSLSARPMWRVPAGSSGLVGGFMRPCPRTQLRATRPGVPRRPWGQRGGAAPATGSNAARATGPMRWPGIPRAIDAGAVERALAGPAAPPDGARAAFEPPGLGAPEPGPGLGAQPAPRPLWVRRRPGLSRGRNPGP
jgi:hypothetical protein